jgi:hypothetical protein
MKNDRLSVLLVIVAVLLTLNLVLGVVGLVQNPREAEANIVSGKNWFTTTTSDAATVHLWQYWNNGVGEHAEGQIKYYGQITAGGDFQQVR